MTVIAAALAVLVQTAAPCAGGPYDDFDFWVGEWRVEDSAGKTLGTNSITKAEADCLIIERWTSAGGSTGQSYNFVDPATQRWRQVWVSAGFTVDYDGALDGDGAMRLEGDITYRNGSTAPFRGVWAQMDDGRVRQSFTQYDPKTERWVPWFEGFYVRTAP